MNQLMELFQEDEIGQNQPPNSNLTDSMIVKQFKLSKVVNRKI